MISVIVPIYNTPTPWVLECLHSLEAQGFGDWEVVIVDDASATPAEASLAEFLKREKRAKLIRHDRNLGIAATRNTGVSASSGDWLLMLDSDDRLAPTYLERMHGALSAKPEADCAVCDFTVFGEVSDVWKNEPKGTRDMVKDHWMPGPGVLISRALYDAAGGYCEDEVFRLGNEDWDFWLTVTERGFVPAYVPDALYEYRVSPGSLSNTAMKRGYYHTALAMYERHRALIDGFGLGRRFRFDGYYFSIRRCPARELVSVAFKALALASGPGDVFRVILAVGKRLAKTLAAATGIFPRRRKSRARA